MKALPEIILTAIFFACVIAILFVDDNLQILIAYAVCLDFGLLLGRIWKLAEIKNDSI